MILQTAKILDGEWRRLVCEDLILPSFKISKIEAVARRMKRNYVFIFGIILVAWTLKIFMHAKSPIRSFSDFYAALAVEHLPSWLAFVVYFGTILVVFGLIIFVARTSTEEINEFGNTNNSLWKI